MYDDDRTIIELAVPTGFALNDEAFVAFLIKSKIDEILNTPKHTRIKWIGAKIMDTAPISVQTLMFPASVDNGNDYFDRYIVGFVESGLRLGRKTGLLARLNPASIVIDEMFITAKLEFWVPPPP